MAEDKTVTEPLNEPVSLAAGQPLDVDIKSPTVTSEASDMIASANVAAKRLEDANKVLENLLTKQEAMVVERTLGGESVAGTPQLTDDEKEDALARKFLEGTGLEL